MSWAAPYVKFYCNKTYSRQCQIILSIFLTTESNMSDGPHRSLPMCRAWKKVARCADIPAFEVEEIRNVIVPALEQDCRQEVSRGFLAGFRKICSDQQPTLFKRDLGPSLEALRRTASPGMERLIVDHAIHAAVKGNTSPDIAEKAVADALRDRGARNGRSVEEHFFEIDGAPCAQG